MKKFYLWSSLISALLIILIGLSLIFIPENKFVIINVICSTIAGLIVLCFTNLSLFLYFKNQEKIETRKLIISTYDIFSELYRVAKYSTENVTQTKIPAMQTIIEKYIDFSDQIQNVNRFIEEHNIPDHFDVKKDLRLIADEVLKINRKYNVLPTKVYPDFYKDVVSMLTSDKDFLDDFIEKATKIAGDTIQKVD